MSGGSMNYFYSTLKEYTNVLGDIELNELVTDLVEVFHDKEWADSADISDGRYNKTVADFKAKWFGRTDKDRIDAVVDAKIKEVYQTLCVKNYCKDCKHWKAEDGKVYGQCKDNRWLTHGWEFGCKEWEGGTE